MLEQNAPERRITRSSYKDSVIEEVRSDSFLPASPYMAVSPIDIHRHILSDRSLLEHTPEHVPDVLDGSHTPPVTESDSLQEPDPDISMDTVSTGVDTDMEDQVFGVGTQCDHPMCVYYGNTGMSKVIKQYYRCQKCSSVEDGIYVMDICCACYNLGAHQRHKKVISLMSDT